MKHSKEQGRSYYYLLMIVLCSNPSLNYAKSICGKNQLKHVNSPEALAQPNAPMIQMAKSAVGVIYYRSQDQEIFQCSGTLISPNLFLTAQHCVNSFTLQDQVYFNYETQFMPESFAIAEIKTKPTDADYTILKLSGDPGYKYGWNPIASNDLALNTAISIIQHPAGERKQYDDGFIKGKMGQYLLYNNVDTQETSSGSGILDQEGKIIGVHTAGGCEGESGSNYGVSSQYFTDSISLEAARLNQLKEKMEGFGLRTSDGVLHLKITSKRFGMVHLSARENENMKLVSNEKGEVFLSDSQTKFNEWVILLVNSSTLLLGQPNHRHQTLWIDAQGTTLKLSERAAPLEFVK